MIQIRKNVFETNSSSTHSICIAKADYIIPEDVVFDYSTYGWEEDCRVLKNYLYTAILELDEYYPEETSRLDRLKKILDRRGIKYWLNKPNKNEYLYNEYYIDHVYDCREFVNAVLDNEELLMRALFNDDSCVYTGNDNTEYEWNKAPCYVACTYENEFRDNNKYEYFYKGN